MLGTLHSMEEILTDLQEIVWSGWQCITAILGGLTANNSRLITLYKLHQNVNGILYR